MTDLAWEKHPADECATYIAGQVERMIAERDLTIAALRRDVKYLEARLMAETKKLGSSDYRDAA
jgi:hypothetical protein